MKNFAVFVQWMTVVLPVLAIVSNWLNRRACRLGDVSVMALHNHAQEQIRGYRICRNLCGVIYLLVFFCTGLIERRWMIGGHWFSYTIVFANIQLIIGRQMSWCRQARRLQQV